MSVFLIATIAIVLIGCVGVILARTDERSDLEKEADQYTIVE